MKILLVLPAGESVRVTAENRRVPRRNMLRFSILYDNRRERIIGRNPLTSSPSDPQSAVRMKGRNLPLAGPWVGNRKAADVPAARRYLTTGSAGFSECAERRISR
jgi:hypothetical protein